MALDPDGNTLEYDSGGLAASGIIQAAPLRLYQLYGFNSLASAQYIQLFDTFRVPANGAVPARPPLYAAASSAFYYDFGEIGSAFQLGLCWSNSSTLGTKTIGSADCWMHAVYR